MEKAIVHLFRSFTGGEPVKTEALPVSGSARRYFRLHAENVTYIGVFNTNVQENILFLDFTRHFEAKGLHVPRIFCVSDNQQVYLQEDLGAFMLLDIVEQERSGEMFNEKVLNLYRKALTELLRFQLLGNEGLDYAHCVPRPVFDRQCIQWDLNYFKYCFLRLAGTDFSEQALEDDFSRLTDRLCAESTDSFMFRDFQSRNIMVKKDEVYFIDYQGGRRGALQYDVASLLYDAIACMPDVRREQLLSYYIEELGKYRPVDANRFRETYYHFVLIRLLQAMGAFGLRGLHEGKPHFIDSIRPGLANILSLFVPGKLQGCYPTIERTVKGCQQSFLVS